MSLASDRSRSAVKLVAAVAAVAAVLALSACAGIPSSGPVTKVADDGGTNESTVRYSPVRPVKGASPQEIVRGYLDAMLAYPVTSGTAAAFLTPDGAKDWSSSASVRVYSTSQASGATRARDSVGGVGGDTATPVQVQLTLTEDARLDRQGHYTRRARPAEISYRLQRVGGEWRIANPQVGMLVNRKFYDDYFRPFTIYYFDRPASRLVPDPIHLAVGDQVVSSLVSSLVRGPQASDKQATRTFVPPPGSLRPSVPVSSDGIADIGFDEDFSTKSESVLDHLSAQIVWTLRQVPDVTGVRLIGSTTPLFNNGSDVQDIDSWGGFGPSITRGHAYAVSGRKVVQIDNDRIRPLTGAWGKDARDATSIGVSDSGVAGVLAGGTRVRVTDRQGRAARTFPGSGLIAPRWDGDGRLWLTDRPGSRTRVRLVEGSKIRTLDIGGLARLGASTFALSPDGSRYAVTVSRSGGATIYVGRVLRDVKDRILGLGDPSPVHTPARAPRSATWSSGTELAYVADNQAGRQLYLTSVDGASTTGGGSRGGALLPDVDADTLAIGTGQSPASYVTDERKRLWYLPATGTWRVLRTGGVTALTYGS